MMLHWPNDLPHFQQPSLINPSTADAADSRSSCANCKPALTDSPSLHINVFHFMQLPPRVFCRDARVTPAYWASDAVNFAFRIQVGLLLARQSRFASNGVATLNRRSVRTENYAVTISDRAFKLIFKYNNLLTSVISYT